MVRMSSVSNGSVPFQNHLMDSGSKWTFDFFFQSKKLKVNCGPLPILEMGWNVLIHWDCNPFKTVSINWTVTHLNRNSFQLWNCSKWVWIPKSVETEPIAHHMALGFKFNSRCILFQKYNLYNFWFATSSTNETNATFF